MKDCKACAEIEGDCLVCQKLQDDLWDHKLDMRGKYGDGKWEMGKDEHDPSL